MSETTEALDSQLLAVPKPPLGIAKRDVRLAAKGQSLIKWQPSFFEQIGCLAHSKIWVAHGYSFTCFPLISSLRRRKRIQLDILSPLMAVWEGPQRIGFRNRVSVREPFPWAPSRKPQATLTQQTSIQMRRGLKNSPNTL